MIRTLTFAAAMAFYVARSAILFGGEDTSTVLKQVRTAWETRQSRQTSGRITWKQVDKFSRGALFYTGSDGNRPLEKRSNLAPVEIISSREFTFDGIRCRYEHSGKEWSELDGDFVNQTRIKLFDGAQSQSLRQYQSATRTYGTFDPHSGGLDTSHLDFNIEIPVMACRPLSPEWSAWPLDRFTVRALSEQVGGVPCVCLHYQQTKGIEHLFWLDPLREFVIVRHDLLVEGHLFTRLDAEYDGSVPRAWRHVMLTHEDHRFREGLTAEVTSVKFDIPIDASAFRITYPPGAQVHRNGSNPGPARFFVRKDGSLRPHPGNVPSGMTLEEYAELPTSEESDSQRFRTISIGVTLLAAALIASLVIWGRRQMLTL
jgi:hypothetical protein